MTCFKNIFVVFWSFLFCYGTLYAKTIIHLTDLSVGEYSARIFTSTLRDSVNILAHFTLAKSP